MMNELAAAVVVVVLVVCIVLFFMYKHWQENIRAQEEARVANDIVLAISCATAGVAACVTAGAAAGFALSDMYKHLQESDHEGQDEDTLVVHNWHYGSHAESVRRYDADSNATWGEPNRCSGELQVCMCVYACVHACMYVCIEHTNKPRAVYVASLF